MAEHLEHWQEPELATLVELLGRLRCDLSGGLGGRSDGRADPPAPAEHPSPDFPSDVIADVNPDVIPVVPSEFSRTDARVSQALPSDRSGVPLS